MARACSERIHLGAVASERGIGPVQYVLPALGVLQAGFLLLAL